MSNFIVLDGIFPLYQIASLRKGLISVVPEAVLGLLTWQELESRICGDPEITIEALKKTSKYQLNR